MQTETQRIRRRSRDTVGIDRHRQEALMLRTQTGARLLKTRKRMATWWPFIGAAAVVAAYVLFLPRTPVPPGASAMLVSAPVSLMPD